MEMEEENMLTAFTGVRSNKMRERGLFSLRIGPILERFLVVVLICKYRNGDQF